MANRKNSPRRRVRVAVLMVLCGAGNLLAGLVR